MKAALLVGALLAAAACAGCSPGRPKPPEGAPSVLVVSIDTLRSDRVGAYGARYGATPVIDALAAEGLRCEKAISPVPITLPAHATLMTGLYPPRHGVRHNGIFKLAPERVTLAERFRDAGYATGAVVGAVVLERRYGLDQGFDRYDDAFGGAQANATGYLERPAADVTAAALAWLAETPGPFFLFAHYYDPHAEYHPPAPFAERFPGKPYEAEIAAVDASIGSLLDGLRAAGRFDDTIVVVTADHGESLGEHGERTHSYGLYDATLSVPLVFRGPGVPAGATLSGVSSLASVAPTLLALAKLPALAASDGEDLVARLAAPQAGAAYAETLATELDHGWAPLHAIRTASRHFVRAPRPELYDVAADPREVANLLPGAGAEAAALDRDVDAVLAHAIPLRTAPVDDATKRNLQELGYLPDAPADAERLDPKDGLRLVAIHFDAQSAFRGGEFARAEARARELLAASPRSAQALMLLADVARARGDLATALAEAERASFLLPASAGYAVAVADLRLDLGDVPGAVAGYRAALDVDPTYPEAIAGSMWGAVLSERMADAEEAADRALAARPGDPALLLRVAESWDRLGNAERALDGFRAVLRLDPESAKAHMGAAIQLAKLGKDAEADADLAKAGAYALDPNYRNRLAIAYAARGENARAEALLRALLAEHPKHANARRNLARLLRTTGRAAEADQIERTAEPTAS
jgi:choline-sulfatase